MRPEPKADNFGQIRFRNREDKKVDDESRSRVIRIEHKIIEGDALEELQNLPEQSVQTVVTSPPYFGLRDYGEDGQIGLESSPDEYVQRLVEVFREVWKVLRDDGTVWLNLGDSYAGSGKGQYEDGSKDPKRKKISGMKLPRSGYNDGRKNRDERLRNGSIASLKPKDLIGMPWRVAFALQLDGWFLRQDIIWSKPNPMPESVMDRCTKSHEYIFLLSKSQKYYYDQEAIKEPHIWGGVQSSYRVGEASKNGGSPQDPIIGKGNTTGSFRAFGEGGRNRRSVWSVSTKPFKEAHFAVFPPELIEPCIMAGAPQGGVVLDPFLGAGTTTMVAKQLGRIGWGIELNHEYCEMARERLRTALHPKNANPRHPAPSQSKITCFCE